MKKEITLGQLVGSAITVLMAVITGWITLNNKVTQNSIEIEQLKADNYKTTQLMQRIEEKQDKLADKLERVYIELQNKKNRD